jgi:hypothetical protein
MGMMNHIINIWKFSNDGNHEDYGFILSEKDLYILMISSLFHDYNHSGGRFDDSINIENAKNGLKECMLTLFSDDDNTRTIISKCMDSIDGTQYPYIINDIELNLYQRILRECDILVCLYDDYITHRIFGLMEEMHTKYSTKMFLAKEIQFILESVKNMKLVYSIDTWNENSEEFMNSIEILTKVIV